MTAVSEAYRNLQKQDALVKTFLKDAARILRKFLGERCGREQRRTQAVSQRRPARARRVGCGQGTSFGPGDVICGGQYCGRKSQAATAYSEAFQFFAPE